MKNITVFAVFVTMWCCVQAIPAQEKQAASYALSICPQFGFLYGQAEEIVYPSPEFKAKKLSQLLWDIKPVFYYGLSLDFARTQPMTTWGFFSNFSLKNGMPGKSGNMEDRDWLSKENKALTNYSISDNITDNLFFFDFSAGFSFPLKRILLMKTYLTVSYMHFSFYGKNGYYTYAQYFGNDKYAPIDSTQKEPLDGKVINYTQDWFIITPGVSLGYYFNTHFYAELVLQISPLIFCDDLDEHLKTKIKYQDRMWGGIFLEPGFHFSWFANKRLEFSLEFSWRYISETRGKTYESSLFSDDFEQNGTAGAGLSIINTGLSLKIHL